MLFYKYLQASIVLTAVISCASCNAVQTSEFSSVSICDINKSKSAYIGKIVNIVATYRTDNSHYEYLLLDSCAQQGILDIGFKVPERNSSVDSFYAAAEDICKQRNALIICALDAKVTVSGRVVQGENDKLLLNLHDVSSFNFAER